MKENKDLFWATLTIGIIFALQPLDLAFGDMATTEPSPYSFITIDIATPDGQIGFTGLTDINNDAEIVGGFADSNLGPDGFLIEETFRLTDIRCPRATSTAPQSINRRGEMSGFCFTDRIRGFFRNRKGKYTFLDFPGANLTEAAGINDDGQVVGDYSGSDGNFHGFFWDAGLFLTIDVPFPKAVLTAPNGINNVGQIVGFWDDNMGGRHGFLYDRGNFTSFDFPDSQLTAPTDINDHGQIVGVYVLNDGVPQSFLLENGRFMTIDVPFLDVIFTDVSGINNRGQIVGRYLTSNPGDLVNPFVNHGFIATPESDHKSRSKKSRSKPLASKANDSSSFHRWWQDVEGLSKHFTKWARQLK